MTSKYKFFCTFRSLENGLEWLKQHCQILGIFHSILHHILYYARVTIIKMQCRIHLVHAAFAPPYGTLLLSAQQLTAAMTGFDHFTETFSNYSLCYYSILEQPYAWFSTAQTTNSYFLQLPVPNPQHGSNHCLSFSKLPYFNSHMLSVHHSYATKPIITAKNHFIQTTIIVLHAQPFGLFILNRSFLLILHRTKQ